MRDTFANNSRKATIKRLFYALFNVLKICIYSVYFVIEIGIPVRIYNILSDIRCRYFAHCHIILGIIIVTNYGIFTTGRIVTTRLCIRHSESTYSLCTIFISGTRQTYR